MPVCFIPDEKVDFNGKLMRQNMHVRIMTLSLIDLANSLSCRGDSLRLVFECLDWIAVLRCFDLILIRVSFFATVHACLTLTR